MSIIVFSIAVAAYFLFHSLLAAERVKSVLSEKLVPPRFYRLFYNVLSLVLLMPLAWMFFSLEKEILLKNEWFALPGGLLLLGGAIWVIQAMRGYHIGEFTGLHQLNNAGRPMLTTLKISGLNRQVRHPLYFGTLLVVWGLFLVSPSGALLVVAVLSTLYLYIGSKLEERKLTQQFGDAYRSYQRDVPMLLPFKFGKKKDG